MKITHNIGFLGAGSIAQAHVFALQAMSCYYNNTPKFHLLAVAANSKKSTDTFAKKFQFEQSLTASELLKCKDINTLFILSPNDLHFEHLKQALQLNHITNIYIEKPLTIETCEMSTLLQQISKKNHYNFQMGFQFLFMPTIRRAYQMLDKLGKLIHFHSRYLHSGYLNEAYREQRKNRLLVTPLGGAIADLGAHAFSLLLTFIGNSLEVKYAQHSGSFSDVQKDSDLHSQVFLRDRKSGAIGFLEVSRISAGATDVLELELRGTEGAIRFSSLHPDILKICSDQTSGFSKR
jgi:predicted dehydrogenase